MSSRFITRFLYVVYLAGWLFLARLRLPYLASSVSSYGERVKAEMRLHKNTYLADRLCINEHILPHERFLMFHI